MRQLRLMDVKALVHRQAHVVAFPEKRMRSETYYLKKEWSFIEKAGQVVLMIGNTRQPLLADITHVEPPKTHLRDLVPLGYIYIFYMHTDVFFLISWIKQS